jgi:DNA (cytosine-5)-methyltransferase 1
LTLRECARVQTFPDWFEFCGNSSEKATLIGNAVPPAFAAVLADHFVEVLGRTPSSSKGARGQLVSFEPTVAEGMSPALRRVTDRVTDRYALASRLSLGLE